MTANIFQNTAEFARAHPVLSICTLGLALVGFLGYRAVCWVLEKTGVIKKTEEVALQAMPKTPPPKPSTPPAKPRFKTKKGPVKLKTRPKPAPLPRPETKKKPEPKLQPKIAERKPEPKLQPKVEERKAEPKAPPKPPENKQAPKPSPNSKQKQQPAPAKKPVATRLPPQPQWVRLEVPADGNCLFHSFIAALRLLQQRSSNFQLDHHSLRQEVVDYLREHQYEEDVRNLMLNAFLDEQEQTLEGLNFEITHAMNSQEPNDRARLPELLQLREQWQDAEFDSEAYLDRLSRPGAFANSAELYALSQLYPVRIIVKSGDNAERTYEHSNSPELLEMRVIHGMNHFDVEVKLV